MSVHAFSVVHYDESGAGAQADELPEILAQGRLSAVFQPIADLHKGEYFGFEGLIRGPSEGFLHTPAALFAAARQCGLELELERACHETVLRAFARLNLPGRLFINLGPKALQAPRFVSGFPRSLLNQLGLAPERVVVELSGVNGLESYTTIREVIAELRKTGSQIAIDNLGVGFTDLRIWSEIRPEFVKTSCDLLSGSNDEELKRVLLHSIREIACLSGSRMVGLGIETGKELGTVLDLGIVLGQGFFIAPPAANPALDISSEVVGRLVRRRSVGLSGSGCSFQQTVGDLVRPALPVTPKSENEEIFRLFESRQELDVIPVVRDDRPIGSISRHYLMDHYARPYCRELYGRKSCTHFMNASPLLIDQEMTVQEAGLIVSRASNRDLGEGFIITREGRYLGMGSIQDLMALMTEMQISAARYANPLTQLPGNVPLSQQIDRLLNSNSHFAACYFDIDHFKPFNDIYGYSRGDEIIQLLAQLLVDASDLRLDFVGHIGGDDFMVLFQSEDWRDRCGRILDAFDHEAVRHCSEDDRQRGGLLAEDRKGNRVLHPLPALSIGALPVVPGRFDSHHEVSLACAEAKKQAKKMSGSSCFVERRMPVDRSVGHDCQTAVK